MLNPIRAEVNQRSLSFVNDFHYLTAMIQHLGAHAATVSAPDGQGELKGVFPGN
jgi:hypothetical protein